MVAATERGGEKMVFVKLKWNWLIEKDGEPIGYARRMTKHLWEAESLDQYHQVMAESRKEAALRLIAELEGGKAS
jgi:hypothetical protein